MPRCRRSLAAVLAFAACQATPAPEAPPGSLACTLAILKTGPRTEPLGKDENAKVFGGHFANMARLAKEGHLLLAGPYGEHRSDPALRGLFVLATPDRARAVQLAESDPAFQAGVFRFEFHALVTSAALRAHIAEELALHEAAERAGTPRKPGEGGRVYVLVTAANGAAVEATLAGNPAVLMHARLDGTKGFVLLDSKDVAAAKVLLEPFAAKLGECVLDEWFGSGSLVQLPQRKA